MRRLRSTRTATLFPYTTLLQSMAGGVACVVTDVGDAAIRVDDASVVAPPQNPPALSTAIDTVVDQLGMPAHAERVHRGRERVGRLFSLEAMVNNYHKVWGRVAAGQSMAGCRR